MTEYKPHSWAEVIKGWADGKPIQYKNRGLSWEDWPGLRVCPNFNSDTILWRIKPEKKSVWINIYPPTLPPCWNVSHTTKERADAEASPQRIGCIEYEYEEKE